MDTPDTTIKAIIFDCFGVLTVDTQQAFFEKVASEDQDEFRYLNTMRDRGKLDTETYFQEVARLTKQPPDAVRDAFLNHHQRNDELLAFIRSDLKPTYKIGLLSNIGRGWINSFFGQELLDELFDAIVLSSEVGITKPDSRIYEHAATQLDVQPAECLMVDDTQRNCEGAKDVGMQAVLFRGTKETKVVLQETLQT